MPKPKTREISVFLHHRGPGQLNINELTASQQAKGSNGPRLEARNSDETNEIEGHKKYDS